MASSARRCGAALLLLLLGGCRADVVVVDREPVPGDPFVTGDFEAWDPVFRVIGPDGEPVTDYRVRLDNSWYYSFLDELAGFYPSRSTSTTYDSDRPDDVTPIHPPFFFEFVGPEGVFDRDRFALVPGPGDTVVIDLRESSHEVVFQPDLPADWPAPDLEVQYTWSPDVAGFTPTNSSICCRYLYFRDIEPGTVGLDLPDQIDRLDTIVVRWNSSLLPDIPSPGGDVIEMVHASYRLQDAAAFLETSDTLALRPRLSTIHVLPVRDGVALKDVPVSLETEDIDPDIEWSLRGTTVTSATPLPMPVFGDRVNVGVSSRSDRLEFFSATIPMTVAPDDTVEVEIGPHDIRVRVVDANGDPVPRASVSVMRLLNYYSISGRTDVDGRYDLPVHDGFYSVSVGLLGVPEPFDRRTILVRDDVDVELTWTR